MSRRLRAPVSEAASALATGLRAILPKLRRQLREHSGQQDLPPSQVSVLLRLEKTGPATVSTLARAEGMRPQSMSSIVNSLLTAGLVDGLPDPQDGRQTLMSLSKKCEKLLRQVRAAKQDWLAARIQDKLSAQEQQQLSAALKLLSRLSEDDPLS